MDFDFQRIMVLFGVLRLILRKEYMNFVWKPLDTAMVLWVISSIFFYVFRNGTFDAVINRIGFAFSAFGMYFLFRCLVRDWLSLERITLGLILISIPVALFFILENRTGRNMFSVFGGVSAVTDVREGKLRCQGAFSHAILAGCFWASLIPLFAAHWWKSFKNWVWPVTGLITSSIIVIYCASSTPAMGVLSAIIGGLFFFLRRQMRIVRWSILFALIALHMVMQSPVWHLISRVSAVGGSTGWHRYNLINQAIINVDDWWFSGCSGYTVLSWGIWAGDVTNQYIYEGVNGGIVTLILFVGVITVAFREVGRLWRLQTHNPPRLALSWALGVSLFVHCMVFIGVSYFGQIWILWYLLLAIIGSLSVQARPVSIPKIRKSYPILKSKC
ncbi:MAG: hypothetical protein H8E17_04105 [Deltaproteobacteria bacterium]|nr:hypothetical protein [Deltaproteobacteria bacterium]